MPRKYSRILDMLLASAIKAKAKDFEGASRHLIALAEDENFDEEIDFLIDMNDESAEEIPAEEIVEEEEVEDNLDEDETAEVEDDVLEYEGDDVEDEAILEGEDSLDEEVSSEDTEYEGEDEEEDVDLEDDEDLDVAQLARTLERASLHRSRSLERRVEKASTEITDKDRATARAERAARNLKMLSR